MGVLELDLESRSVFIQNMIFDSSESKHIFSLFHRKCFRDEKCNVCNSDEH